VHDASGFYYYPNPEDVQSRVYVRQGLGDIEFRLWHSAYPEVWERHGWVAYSTIEQLAALYKERGSGSDPLALYDINVARALVKEQRRKQDA
jgi:hypothetical protein